MNLTDNYTTEEVARIFKCHPEHVRTLARKKKLDVVIVARKLLFPKESVHKYLQERLIKGSR